ncbi:hypothetical protein K3169_01075 [Pseudomonas phytophila]|uniref:Phage protein n=1 Tax=Pseudomonas phytophila TaxID=2867264 RepID=A0ABY6FFY9_9PSED|nr:MULTISPECIES: hypothetical protein [Pseudomonas]MCD5989525.1 hypothetical protein [Pseudomonas quasicaspiana]UXZ96543.1 hypothetical protein K3169_01075 [Pseudomonas phytophila]
MISGELKAFVEKADGDVIRVKVNDRDLSAELAAVGFLGALEEGVFERYVADDVEKAKVFDSLRLLHIAFSNGKEWCPAEVFEYLRDKALLSGEFVRVSWTQPGQYRLEFV